MDNNNNKSIESYINIVKIQNKQQNVIVFPVIEDLHNTIELKAADNILKKYDDDNIKGANEQFTAKVLFIV